MVARMLVGIVIAAYTLTACAINKEQTSARAVVEQRFAAVRRHDVDAITLLYAMNAVETSPGFCHERVGQDGVRRTYSELFQAFPDISDEVITTLVDGEHVAVQFVARSRRPDGTVLFEIPLANFLTVQNGRITRDETYFDTRGRPCS
jgi:ketosteroid isomerase-like protein